MKASVQLRDGDALALDHRGTPSIQPAMSGLHLSADYRSHPQALLV